jgi:hypothetical protein
MKKETSLAEYPFSPRSFTKIEETMATFSGDAFNALNRFERNDTVNRALFDLIESHADRGFLLTEVIDYVSRVIEQGIFTNYSFSEFELWLIQFSGVGDDARGRVCDLVAGKSLPRDEYQAFFPIAMGKQYEGTHIVTAHSSPDLDTMVGSFWGWLDAFSARVGTGMHLWNVPGGPPSPHVEVELLFKQMLGRGTFKALAKTREELTLSSLDLITQEGYLLKRPHDLMMSTYHERNQNAVVMVNDDGYYIGDWRPFDVEGVRQVIMSLNNSMRWLESQLHVRLITLFAQEKLNKNEFTAFVERTFSEKICDLDPVREYSKRQLDNLAKYLAVVLGCGDGIETTFGQFAKEMDKLGIGDLAAFEKKLHALASSEMFEKGGAVTEKRPVLFAHLEKIMRGLELAFRSNRYYMESLGVALQIKREVLGYMPQSLSHRTDIQEVRAKMGSYPYLTVSILDTEGCRIPLGVIHSSDLKKKILATATLRDFSNREETKIPDFIEVISVIDHHKTSLTTNSPPMVLICDAQSSNALIADIAMRIYDKYSTAGMDRSSIEKQIAHVVAEKQTPSNLRLLQRLYNRLMALDETDSYISKDREYVEYIHYLFAILDDTDLLTKISKRDVITLGNLLNRLKTLHTEKEVEVIAFDDLPKGRAFTLAAAKRLLQHPDLFALYSKVYTGKEALIEENLIRCSEGLPSSIFIDTKIQNGCCRVGQTKIFAKNVELLSKVAPDMRKYWLKHAKYLFREHPGVDLHLHMVSTVASASELHSGEKIEYAHEDEMWFWIPFNDLSIEHLKLFLSAFKRSREIANGSLHLETFGSKANEIANIFRESFRSIPIKINPTDSTTVAVLRYNAGLINSRKAMVAPYLPKIVVN